MASAGFLRSRRFRGVVMVLVPILWIGYYALTQMLARWQELKDKGFPDGRLHR